MLLHEVSQPPSQAQALDDAAAAAAEPSLVVLKTAEQALAVHGPSSEVLSGFKKAELGELTEEALASTDGPNGHSDGCEEQRQCMAGQTGGGTRRRCYSRSEMEGLRFMNVEEQRRRWGEVVQSLGPVVGREYEELAASSEQNSTGRSGWRQQKSLKERNVPWGKMPMQGAGSTVSIANPHMNASIGNLNLEGNLIDEEFCNEDEDSDDEYNGIQKAAFYVEGEPDFESGPPQDGLEYLRRVRWEATQIPNVKVAKLDRSKCKEQTPYMPNIPDVSKCPDNLLPLKQWEDAFLADFSKLREAFSQLETSEKVAVSAPGEHLRNVKLGFLKGLLPTMSAIRPMDSISRTSMLRRSISEFEDTSAISRNQCLWLYALCVAVDAPLDAEMSGNMRSLLRKCSSLLAEKSDHDEEAAMLNILIAISGKYFGQSKRSNS